MISRQHHLIAVATLAILAITCLGGCSSYTAPTLKVASVRAIEETDEAIVLSFAIDATNANRVPLPLRSVSYNLEIDGKQVFEGTRSPEATIRRLGTQRITLPTVVRAADLPAATGQHTYRITGQLLYVTPGEFAELLFDSGVRRPTVSFTDAGTLDFGDTR